MNQPTSSALVNATNTRLTNVRTTKLHLDLDVARNEVSENIKQGQIGVELEQKNGANKEQRSVMVVTTIRYLLRAGAPAIVEHESEFTYHLEPFEQWVAVNEDDVIVEPAILSQLYLLTVSTIRGILIEKLGNTPFSKMYLPLIDESSMVDILESGN